MKTHPAENFFPCMSGMSLCPAFKHRLTSLWHTFFGTIALMEFVLKNACQQFCSFSLAPCQRSYACPMAQGLETLAALGRTVFRSNRIDEICPLPATEAMHVTSPNVCKPLEKSWAHNFFGTITLMKFVLKTRCEQLCFSVRRFFPTELSPSYFPRRPFRPPCRHSRIAPSHRSSSRAISDGFPSAHPVVTPVSLLPTGTLPRLFPTVSLPSTLSFLPYRSFPPELSPNYFTRFPFRPPSHHSRIAPSHRSSPSYFPRFPFRPPCRHSRLAPSHRSSPRAISHGVPSVHPVVTPVSLLPTGALPKLFPTASLPSTLSSLPYRSFPPELSPSYSPRFPFRPPCRHSRIAPSHRSSPQAIPTVSLPSTLSSLPYRSFPPELFPSYFRWFPFRPPCRHSRIAPSHRNSPQAISHGFPSVHPVVPSVSVLPTGTLPKLFHTVSLPSTLSSLPYRSFPPELPKLFPAVSLPPTLSSFPSRSFPPELSPCYFPRRPFGPPCRHSRLAPSHRCSPQAISHGVPSVHPVVTPVSLLPTGTLPKLFPTVSLPPTLSSFPHRSFPPELSPSYTHGFPSVHPVVTPVSLLPTGALPKLFPTVSLPSTLSSLPYRSFPPELPRLFPTHGFPSVHPVVTPAFLFAASATKREPKHQMLLGKSRSCIARVH